MKPEIRDPKMTIFKTYSQKVSVKRLNSIARDYWAPAGVVLTLVLGLLPLYFQFFPPDEEPGLVFELTGNTEILLSKFGEIDRLDMLYQGRNLNDNGQTLRLLTLRVTNKGEVTILPGFYDENDPLGFMVKGGKITALPELIETSSTYIRSALTMNRVSPEKVTFSCIILDPGAGFTIQALVLHPQGKVPVVRPSGKIAGISRIRFIDARRQKRQSWLERTLGGDIGVQLMRLAFYPVVLSALLLTVAAIWNKVAKFKTKRE